MFITFEGIDCCGKSTQARLLAERLKESGRSVQLLREPGNTRLSEHVREVLLSQEFSEMNERAELLLFAASRAQLVGEVIIPALEGGTIVLCDRFSDSTLAYQGYGRQLPLEDIEHVNRIATQDLVPDMTFYLDISPEASIARCRERPNAKRDRMEANGIRFFERVIDGYMRIAEGDRGRFYVIDGGRTIEEIAETIGRLVTDRLESGGAGDAVRPLRPCLRSEMPLEMEM